MSIRNTFLFVVLTLLTANLGVPQAAAQLDWTLGAGTLQQAEGESDVDQWDTDVLNLTVTDSGVLLLDTQGVDLEGTSAGEDLCSVGQRSLGSWLARGSGRKSRAVRPGSYTVQLYAQDTPIVKYRVQARLLAACTLASGDDHGDSAGCATQLCSGVAASGAIASGTPADDDYFTFHLASAATVTLESTGTTDVAGELLDETGRRIAEDDQSGSGNNFLIVESLAAGRYFVRVRGSYGGTGSYGLSLQ